MLGSTRPPEVPETAMRQDVGVPSTGAPLTSALVDWAAAAAPEWGSTRRTALLRRLGWIGTEIPTLAEVGRDLNLTRERVRQLTLKLLHRLHTTAPPETDALEAVVSVLETDADPTWTSLGEALWAAGLTEEPLPDEGVVSLLGLLGRSELVETYARQIAGTLQVRKEALRRAKALTRSVGVSCIEWVALDAGLDHKDLIRSMLTREPWCEFLDRDWYWDPSVPSRRNRTENVTVKMLAACGPLEIQEIREGLDRVHRFRPRKMLHIPSPAALRLFYAAHPRFVLGPSDEVAAREALDPMVELDDTERALYTILSNAPYGVLDRAELIRQGIAAGVNQNSLSIYTSYSPILDNPVQDRWTLRGRQVSPAALDLDRRTRRPRFHDEAWQETGLLRVTREVGTTWGLVISVPQAYVRLLGGVTFAALDQDGQTVGQIRFNETGASWGYSRFLQSRVSQAGDLLVADFDLAARTCRLALNRASLSKKDGRADD